MNKSYLRPVEQTDSTGKSVVGYYVFEPDEELPTLEQALQIVASPLVVKDDDEED